MWGHGTVVLIGLKRERRPDFSKGKNLASQGMLFVDYWFYFLTVQCKGSEVDCPYFAFTVYSETKCNPSFKRNGQSLLSSKRSKVSKEKQQRN